ncbi:MAG: hypothetical protein ACOY0T_05255 [Myxococcota bacterium]
MTKTLLGSLCSLVLVLATACSGDGGDDGTANDPVVPIRSVEGGALKGIEGSGLQSITGTGSPKLQGIQGTGRNLQGIQGTGRTLQGIQGSGRQ